MTDKAVSYPELPATTYVLGARARAAAPQAAAGVSDALRRFAEGIECDPDEHPDTRAAAREALCASKPQAAVGVSDEQIKSVVSHEIGFEWLDGELQSVTGDELLRVARAVLTLSPATKPEAPAPATFMTEDRACEWAWGKVREDVGTKGWTTGDSCNFYGFFRWGWIYRGQYELQRTAAPAEAPANEGGDAATPGPWVVRRQEHDCFVAATDVPGTFHDFEIMGSSDYQDGREPGSGLRRKLADAELIVEAVNALRAARQKGGV